MEFVCNDGEGEWDNHDPYGKVDNYTITAEGSYRLEKGKLVKVA